MLWTIINGPQIHHFPDINFQMLPKSGIDPLVLPESDSLLSL
jgi:hypothetical protein